MAHPASEWITVPECSFIDPSLVHLYPVKASEVQFEEDCVQRRTNHVAECESNTFHE